MWKTVVSQPGYFGAKRDATYAAYNQQFGEGQWRIAWECKGQFLDFLGLCILYEDAYYTYLLANPALLQQLVTEAKDVYDDAPSNQDSGFNYLKQETGRTHVQDIAIRRCVLRLGELFQGSELIQIRSSQGSHPLSVKLSPGQVPFHLPELIRQPELKGWWQPGSVEAFYQSNKVVQVLE